MAPAAPISTSTGIIRRPRRADERNALPDVASGVGGCGAKAKLSICAFASTVCAEAAGIPIAAVNATARTAAALQPKCLALVLMDENLTVTRSPSQNKGT